MDYKQIINNKFSVREYKNKKVRDDTFRELTGYANSCPRLVDDIDLDIRVMDNEDVYRQLDGFAGYHGILINAPHYVILLSEKKDHYIENAGYVGESISMKAFELGVDSCWITFKDSKTVIEKLNLVTDKEVVGILTLGYGKKQRTDTVGKAKTGDTFTQVNLRKKESSGPSMALEDMVFIDNWNNNIDFDDLRRRALYEPMDSARKAPSTLNRQPWRFIIDGGKIILTVREDPETSIYEEHIDAGIAMLYFECVTEQTLCKCHWDLSPVENTYNIPDTYHIIGTCIM